MDFRGDNNAQLYAELRAMREQLDNFRRECQEAKRERNALSAQLSDIRFREEIAKQDNERLKAQIAALVEENKRLKEEADKPSVAAGGGRPAVVAEADEGLIVDVIPSLHRAHANLSSTGHWSYWDTLPDGRFKWAPKWVEGDE